MYNPIRLLAVLILLFSHQVTSSEYQHPSPALSEVIEQQKPVSTRLSHDKQFLAILTPFSQTGIDTLAQPELKLAGLRISAQTLTPSRSKNRYQEIAIHHLPSGKVHYIGLKGNEELHQITFSPDSRYLSFIGKDHQGAHLYLHHLASNHTQKLTTAPLNASLGYQYQWLHDSSAIATSLALQKQATPDTVNTIGPNISISQGKRAPRRTYQDLLKNAADEALFKQVTLSQLSLIRLDGTQTHIGEPGINLAYTLSPNDRYILVKQIVTPYSRIVKYRDFNQSVSLYNTQGEKVRNFDRLESGEFHPAGSDSVRKGPRMIHWRQDRPNTIAFVRPLDGGDANIKRKYRDQLVSLTAPFENEPKVLANTPWRITSIQWGEENRVLIGEEHKGKKQLRVSLLDTVHPQQLTLWYQRGLRDSYNSRGKLNYDYQHSAPLVDFEGDKVVHYGLGASAQGYHPYLRQTDILNHSSELLWQSSPDHLEKVVYLLNREPLKLLISRENKTTPKQLILLDMSSHSEKVLYQSPKQLQSYQGITRQLVTYKRSDGLPLSGVLYLPAGYTKTQGPLPLLMWAYPREYKDPKVASQVNYSPHQYQGISPKGPVPFVTKGYAVFDKVAMPIVGEGQLSPNDSFRTQLVANAQAAINTLSAMGVADPQRVAIGGHSYGAFMVANLLAHSDLFSAGIARSGAYNRSLTPFGFQYEKRNYWEAPELYQQMSPFTHADKIDEPLLLIHGEMDANSGTYPMQSERLFKAIRGLGGTSRLVTLPYESHSYVAKESLAHMLWEQEQWLDSHLATDNTKQEQTVIAD